MYRRNFKTKIFTDITTLLTGQIQAIKHKFDFGRKPSLFNNSIAGTTPALFGI
jgi:hypothetical protein